MSTTGTVYAIRHEKTGKLYIGSTMNLESRIETHMSKLRNHKHPCAALQEDHDTYGDDYSLFILYQGNVQGTELTDIEHTFMSLMHTRNPKYGYNEQDPSGEFCLSHCRQAKIPKQRIRSEIKEFAPKNQNPENKKAAKEKSLSDSERYAMIAKMLMTLGTFPAKLQDRFVRQFCGNISGAAIALRVLKEIDAGQNGEKYGAKSDDTTQKTCSSS